MVNAARILSECLKNDVLFEAAENGLLRVAYKPDSVTLNRELIGEHKQNILWHLKHGFHAGKDAKLSLDECRCLFIAYNLSDTIPSEARLDAYDSIKARQEAKNRKAEQIQRDEKDG